MWVDWLVATLHSFSLLLIDPYEDYTSVMLRLNMYAKTLFVWEAVLMYC